MRATKFAMSLGVIMVLGRGKSAKFYSQALLIEVSKKEIKRTQQFDHLMLWNPFFKGGVEFDHLGKLIN
jgi:hypothetical protein